MPPKSGREAIYVDDGDVMVTSKRVVFGGQTYAVNGLVSVGFVERNPAPGFVPKWLFVGFLFLVLAAIIAALKAWLWALVVGGFAIVAPAIAMRNVPPKQYGLKLGFSSGASHYIESSNLVTIAKVERALNQAIIEGSN